MNYHLSQEEVSAIHKFHIQNVDKFYRMFAGVGSRLLSVESNTINLEIIINDSWLKLKTLEETAFQFLENWKNVNKALQPCKYYRIYIYNSHPLGHTIYPKDTNNTIVNKINTLKKKHPKVLIKVFTNSN